MNDAEGGRRMIEPVLTALRDVTEADLPILFEYQREPDANRMAAFPPRELGTFMHHWRTNILGSARTTKKAILVGGEVAGSVVSWDAEDKRLVGYWIGQRYWGRGVASAALPEFVAVHEAARPLHAYVALTNVRSVRVLEKCGFEPTGVVVVGADGVEDALMRLG
jgi:RimJ/RimL family protein N-acetyltransferase